MCSDESAISTGQARLAGLGGNVMNENANPLPFPPVRSLGAAALQRRDHKLLSAGPFHVAEAQPVQRRLLERDRVNLPAALAVAAKPLERAGALGVGRSPAGPEGEVDPAVAVDVVRLDADVVTGGRPADDVVLSPAWVLVPDDRILGRDHDVGLAVAVHVGHRDRVADLAGMRVDLLRFEIEGNRPRPPAAREQPARLR